MSKSQFEKDVTEFGRAAAGVPSEMRQWWKDGHTWTRAKYEYETVDNVTDGHTPGPFSLVAYEIPDYTLWRRLGYVSDALLALIVVLVVLMVVL